jgi:release factor glutamine methyltransferase
LSIQQRVADARQRLRDSGLSDNEARLGARLLAQHALGWNAERYLAHSADAEPEGFAGRYASFIERRGAREPLAYIVGVREFWGLDFVVTPDVLIPRAETELIVQAAIDLFPSASSALSFVDVGTGSGCVAVAIASEREFAAGIATDISQGALVVAQQNATKHHVENRLRFAHADLLEGIDGEFDLIVSNPPYVRAGDEPALQPEVRREPSPALYGGPDGFQIMARLLAQAPARLKPGAPLIFEFGCGQEVEVEQLVRAQAGLAFVEFRRDLQGLARTAIARRV